MVGCPPRRSSLVWLVARSLRDGTRWRVGTAPVRPSAIRRRPVRRADVMSKWDAKGLRFLMIRNAPRQKKQPDINTQRKGRHVASYIPRIPLGVLPYPSKTMSLPQIAYQSTLLSPPKTIKRGKCNCISSTIKISKMRHSRTLLSSFYDKVN